MDSTSDRCEPRAGCRRFGAGDLLFAVVLGLIVFGGSHVAAHAQPERESFDAVGYTLLSVGAASTLLRRFATRAFLVTATAVASTYLALGYPYGPLLIVVAAASASVAARYAIPIAGPLLVAAALTITGAAFIGEYDGGSGNWFGALAQVGWVAIAAVIGTLARNARIAGMTARGEASRRVQEESRLRLAREVHDVVGHDLSVISLQAGVALHILDREPQQVRAALEAIRQTSTRALDELRATLAMTRGDTTDARRDTGAGLARIPGVISGLELCGLTVTTTSSGFEPSDLPPDVDLVAFRVIQESLTNILRHSSASTAIVDLRLEDGTLTLSITDPGPGRPAAQDVSGRGLRGLAERVREIGGRLDAGPHDDGWQVLATLQVPVVATR